MSALAVSFATQLELMGLWKWAMYVLAAAGRLDPDPDPDPDPELLEETDLAPERPRRARLSAGALLCLEEVRGARTAFR